MKEGAEDGADEAEVARRHMVDALRFLLVPK